LLFYTAYVCYCGVYVLRAVVISLVNKYDDDDDDDNDALK